MSVCLSIFHVAALLKYSSLSHCIPKHSI